METIEGLSDRGDTHPLQDAFTPATRCNAASARLAMLLTAHALLSEEPDCDVDRVRDAPCGQSSGSYIFSRIVEAVLEGRAAYRKG